MRRASRRSVRCTMCTPHRWLGNRKDRVRWWKDAERTRTPRDRPSSGEAEEALLEIALERDDIGYDG